MGIRFMVLLALGALILIACGHDERSTPPAPPAPSPPPPATGAVESVYTDLGRAACREEVDTSDPNETRYLVCPGVLGHSLIQRRVESGRVSIEVVDPDRNVRPLDYHEVVTRHMMALGDRAEWRVATEGGPRVPIALIVPVEAHEDLDEPERVTRTYLAVAKLTATEACVTDAIPDGPGAEARARSAADTARERPCASPRPPLAR